MLSLLCLTVTRQPFLARHVDQLLSPLPDPRPACFRCGCDHPELVGPRRVALGVLPRYRCPTCGAHYTRLSRTPLAHRHLARTTLMALLERLPEPLTLRRAADEIGIGHIALGRIVRALRAWLLELDPSGEQEAKVQLGGLLLSSRSRDTAPAAVDETARLADVLTRAVDDLRSRRVYPLPDACPHCGHTRVTLRAHASTSARQPTYACRGCGRAFTRLTGTPLARSRWPEKQRQFVRYLHLPMQLAELAEVLSVDQGTVLDWRTRYHALAWQLDPTGELAASIRLAPAVDETGDCPACGRANSLACDATRQWHCTGCGRFFSKRLLAGRA